MSTEGRAGRAPVPGLPLASCQLLSTLTEPLLMSVPAAAVKVAV